jgi:hypothetical protein
MQQFAALARQQSRPPIAISGVSLKKRDHYSTSTSDYLPIPTSNNLDSPSTRSHPPISASKIRHHGFEEQRRREDESSVHSDRIELPLPLVDSGFPETASCQTISYNPLSIHPYWNQDVRPALDRALRFAEQTAGGQIALCRFVRIVSRAAIESMSRIAYHIAMEKNLRTDVESATKLAERKKAKWIQSSAFIVALMGDQPPHILEHSDVDSFQELPYIPPASSMQLEEVSLIDTQFETLRMNASHSPFMKVWYSIHCNE